VLPKEKTMALKPVLESLEGVPEILHEHYTLVDGKYVLDVPVDEHPATKGMKNALNNVREEHRRVKEEISKFKGVDPTKYNEMLAHEQQIQEGKLIAEGKVEELLALRTQALRDSLTKETATYKSKADLLQAQLDKLVIDNAVQSAAAKHGVKKGAVEDVLFRARTVFKAHEGQAIAYQGENPMYGKDGVTLLGIDEWIQSLPAVAPHLFEESRGTSAPGGGAPKPVAGPGTITRQDPNAILQNLEAIAKGKVKVL
jgi:hypothetical protein